MKKWIDRYTKHIIHMNIDNIILQLEQADSITFPEQTNPKDNIARLKNSVEYIKNRVENCLPQLVGVSTLDNINSIVTNCMNQVIAFNENKNVAHLENANNTIDTALPFVSTLPYAINGKKDSSIQSIVSAFEKKIANIEQSINGKKENIEKDLADIKNTIEALNKSLSDIKNSYNNQQIIIADLSAQYQKQFSDDQNSRRREFSEKINIIQNDINNFMVKLSEEISRKHNEMILEIDSFHNEQKLKYDTTFDKIDSLLHGATNAGLAYAFSGLRERFDKGVNHYSKIFYIALSILLLTAFISVTSDIGWFYIKFIETFDPMRLLNKFPIILPVIWLALFASKRRSEYQRLQQEYSHKESLAKSYESFKKQAQELNATDDNNDILKRLLDTAISAVAFNASDTLDKKHGDKIPVHEFVDSFLSHSKDFVKDINWESFFSGLRKFIKGP